MVRKRRELTADHIQALFKVYWPRKKEKPPTLVACYPVAVGFNNVAIAEIKKEGIDPRTIPGGSPFVPAPDPLVPLKNIRRPAHATLRALRAARNSVASQIVDRDADEGTRSYFQEANDRADIFITTIDRAQQALDELLALRPPAPLASTPASYLLPRITRAWNSTSGPPKLGIGRDSPLVKFIVAALGEAGWPRTADQISNELRRAKALY